MRTWCRDVRLLTRKQRIGSIDADYHHIRSLLVIQLTYEATFSESDVANVCVVRRDTLCVSQR
jgi:hypothetical protein